MIWFKRGVESLLKEMCFTTASLEGSQARSKHSTHQSDVFGSILPGLPDDVGMYCLALVPRSSFPMMGAVSKRWESVIQSKEFLAVRKEAGKLEEWLFVLTSDATERGNHWEILGSFEKGHCLLPPMPGPSKSGFAVVVLDGNLLVMGGYVEDDGIRSVSSDAYKYDSRLNRWTLLAKMNTARHDFACAEVDGLVYAVGGFGSNGESLSCAEVYDPECGEWSFIESLRRPRWGCFACGLEGKLYVMGGRSTFTIGNSKFVDVYNSKFQTWCEMKNGCVMVTAHAVLGKKLFCMEWKNQRKLAIFDPIGDTWKMIPLPLTGSSRVGFRFGILNDKLILFSLKEEPGCQTLIYDPDASFGDEWKTSTLKPSGVCLCSVSIKA